MTAVFSDFGTAPNRKASLKASSDSHYQTSCSICRLGVYANEPAVWTRGRYLGISHAACALDLCGLCGTYVEGLAQSGYALCPDCTVSALVLERYGPPEEVARERFTQAERTRR